MKIVGLILAIMLLAVTAQAQCVAEVKDVVQDNVRGSIIVQTEYKMNGTVVQNGQTRYLETSGTNAEIINKVKADVKIHCENLVRRLSANREKLQSEKLAKQKALTAPVITSIKPSLVGFKETVISAKDEFKGKEITVNADSSSTVKDVVYIAPISR